MLNKNRQIKVGLNMLLDAVLLFAAFGLANYLRFNFVRFFEPGGAGPALEVARDPRNWLAGGVLVVCLVVGYWMCGVYDASRLHGFSRRCAAIAAVNGAGVLVFITGLYMLHQDNYSRVVLGLFYAIGTGAMLAERLLRRWYDRSQRRKGLGLRHVLLVGGGAAAAQYLRALEHNPYYGFQVDGYLCDRQETAFPVPWLGGYKQLDACMEQGGYDEVVLALEAFEISFLPKMIAACDRQGIRITMVPFYNDYLPARPTIDVLDECKLINVRQTPFDNLLNAFVKRAMDVAGSLVLILLTSPVMLVVAVGVKLSSPGPVIFKQ